MTRKLPSIIEGVHILDAAYSVNEMIINYTYHWLTTVGKYELDKDKLTIVSRLNEGKIEYALMINFKKIGSWSVWEPLELNNYNLGDSYDYEGLVLAMRERFKLRRAPNRTAEDRVKKEIAEVTIEDDDTVFVKYTDGTEEITMTTKDWLLNDFGIHEQEVFEVGQYI